MSRCQRNKETEWSDERIESCRPSKLPKSESRDDPGSACLSKPTKGGRGATMLQARGTLQLDLGDRGALYDWGWDDQAWDVGRYVGSL